MAAFAVSDPAPRLEPAFDQTTAVGFTTELARLFPDRRPGSRGGAEAAAWVSDRFADIGLQPQLDAFEGELAGLGRTQLVNVLAVAPGASPETIVVVAHRDNSGITPGANDNASGTGVLLELARDADVLQPAHTLLFVSSDGGAYGGAGAARLAEHPELLGRLIGSGAATLAVVVVDAVGSGDPARIIFSGDAARSPSPNLVATADASVAGETGRPPDRAAVLAQLVDLGFPFALHEQGPFVARGTPAVTLTTGNERPAEPERDTVEAIAPARIGELGRAAHDLVLRLDASAELARGTQSYLYIGGRVLPGWTIQLLLLAALLPFLVATVDLFARCRRRHVTLAPALRSFASRLGVWLWAGALFALLAATGALAEGDARPINPDAVAAGRSPVAALAALGLLAGAGWLVARPRLVPRRPLARPEELGGHLATMLVLALVALVVAGTNPYALLFLLPSLHAWLWLAHLQPGRMILSLGLFALGLAGPAVLVASFAVRFGLGLDTPWYLLALTSVGYVALPLLLAALVWGAVAGQVGALAAGRYAPYPPPGERGRGPIRATIRRAVLARRARTVRAEAPRKPDLRAADADEP